MAIISLVVFHLRIQLTPAVTSESIARLGELRLLTHLGLVYNLGRSGSLDAIKDMFNPLYGAGGLGYSSYRSQAAQEMPIWRKFGGGIRSEARGPRMWLTARAWT